mgnify:CR=1 FL=1
MGFWLFMLAMNLILPVSMIFFGKYFSKQAPEKINMLFGYRTTRSTKNEDTWRFAHSVFGRIWYRTGLILLPVTLAAMLLVFGRDKDMVGTVGSIVCLVQLPVMLYAILPTERALKKNFDEDGKRK